MKMKWKLNVVLFLWRFPILFAPFEPMDINILNANANLLNVWNTVLKYRGDSWLRREV